MTAPSTWRGRLALAGTVAACGWLATPWVAWWARERATGRRRRLGLGVYAVPRRDLHAAWYGRPGLTAQWWP